MHSYNQRTQKAKSLAISNNHSSKQHSGETAQPQSLQMKENKTGLPDDLKTGIENLSGYSMDDVKVHYNSDQPAQLNALAFARGSDIHIGSGQERHLPHEAWHVVQQKQGRATPSIQMKEGDNMLNDDMVLEREADIMGTKAMQFATQVNHQTPKSLKKGTSVSGQGPVSVVQLKTLTSGKLNVAGEDHSKSDKRRDEEKQLAREQINSVAPYWEEFQMKNVKTQKIADPELESVLQIPARLYQAIMENKENSKDERKHLIEITSTLLISKPQFHDQSRLSGEQVGNIETLFAELKDVAMATMMLIGSSLMEKLADVEKEGSDTSFQDYLGFKKEEMQDDWTEFHARMEEIMGMAIDSDDIAMKRSVAMHQAALLMPRSGLWKIGNQHVVDIMSEFGRPSEYELWSMSEFDSIYQQWSSELEKRKVSHVDASKWPSKLPHDDD